MERRDVYGAALVAAQGVCLAAVAWPGRRRWTVPAPVALAAAAGAVGGAALAAAGLASLGEALSPLPAPRAGAPLRTGGVYALVRHPIYAGLLAGAGGVAVLRGRPEPLAGAAGLAAVLHVKSRFEDGLLRATHGPKYDAYACAVPSLLPWPRPSRATSRTRPSPASA